MISLRTKLILITKIEMNYVGKDAKGHILISFLQITSPLLPDSSIRDTLVSPRAPFLNSPASFVFFPS